MPARGKRLQKQAPKYKDSDESASGEDFEDSGSDAPIPENEDDDTSSIDSDNEFEEVSKKPAKKPLPRTSTVFKQPPKSRISMETIKRNLKSAGSNEPKEDSSTDPETNFTVKDLKESEKLLPSFLNLSESDTDGSDDETSRRPSTSKEPVEFKLFVQKSQESSDHDEKSVPKSNKITGRLSDSGSDGEMEDVDMDIQKTIDTTENTPPVKKLNFQHLQEHAKRLQEAKESLESYNKRHSAAGHNDEGPNIQQLLAMGETEPKEEAFSSAEEASGDSDAEDLEEVTGEAKSSIPKGGIQLVLDLPTDRPRHKKKQLDLEMMMKRRMNRVKKEYQVFTHKVHVLCWLAHGNFVNGVLNEQSIMASALSLIPSEQCYPSNRIDIKYIQQVTKWYNGAMNLVEDKSEFKYKPKKRPLNLSLLQQINKKTAISKKNLVLIFVSMLRSLGIKCRVVFSFRTVPLRPPDTELCSLSTKDKQPHKKGVVKNEETSKHFKNNASKSDERKVEKSSSNKSSKSVDGELKKGKNAKCKNKVIGNIPQLDGLDDRDSPVCSQSSRPRNKSKSLALNKSNTSKSSDSDSPKASSSGTSSYWDQLLKNNGIEEPIVEKRICHRNLQLKSSSRDSSKTKIKDEPTFNASILDESTKSVGNAPYVKRENDHLFKVAIENSLLFSNVLNDSMKSSVDSSTTNLPHLKNSTSNVSSQSRSQSSTRSSNLKESSPKLSSQSRSKHDTQKAATMQKKSTNPPEKGERASQRIKQAEQVSSKNLLHPDDAKSVAKTNSRTRKVKSPVPDGETVSSSKKPKVLKKSTAEPKTVPSPTVTKGKLSRKATETTPNIQIETTKKTLKLTLSEKQTGAITRKTDMASKENTPKPPIVRRKKNSDINEADSNSSTTQQNAAKKKKSETPAVTKVSKYFSPPGKSDTRSKTKQAPPKSDEKRVSHRDLNNKPSPGTSSQATRRVDVTKDLISLVKDRIKETKTRAVSKLVKGRFKEPSDEDSDYVEQETVSKKKTRRESSNNSDADFKPSKTRVSNLKTIKDRRVLSTDDEQSNDGVKKRGVDVWCEVYAEEEEQWISVDVIKAQVHCAREIYLRSSHPTTYIVSWDSAGHLKDVTRRYVPHWNTTTRKLRADQQWYQEALQPWLAPYALRDAQEDNQLDRMQLDAPLPVSIVEYKNHPLYALKRHLLKFEVIYPPDAITLGFVKKEAVYARDCVHVCRSRETWVKEAKVVKPGEQPYKVVKARPKYDRSSGTFIRDIPLEIFGPWQVQDYEPPQAENGQVPRNPYGNVELFKACMLPKGTVHLQLPSLNKVARKLGIDCAPAMTGFDYHSGWCHPVYDGFVVCEEFRDQLVLAWEQEQEEAEQRSREKIEKRVYGNWKRLIRGLFIRERLKAKYDFQAENPNEVVGCSKAPKRSKGPRFLAKRRRSHVPSSGSDSS